MWINAFLKIHTWHTVLILNHHGVPESRVGIKCSGETDVTEIASTRRTRLGRESHGKIWTLKHHWLRGLLVSGVGGPDSSKNEWSPFSQSRRSSGEVAWWAQSQQLRWNQRYCRQRVSECACPPHLWLHRWSLHTFFHYHPNLVMLDKRGKRKNGKFLGIKVALRRRPAPAKRGKEKKSKKWRCTDDTLLCGVRPAWSCWLGRASKSKSCLLQGWRETPACRPPSAPFF